MGTIIGYPTLREIKEMGKKIAFALKPDRRKNIDGYLAAMGMTEREISVFWVMCKNEATMKQWKTTKILT